jgi:hypothetical protein
MVSQRQNSGLRLTVPVLALGVIPLITGSAEAQTTDSALYRDLWQTVQARKLLMEDALLGPLNLGVKVTNRAAVLWGPIPSQQLSLRAEQCLRTMFELTEVRNCLTIEPMDDAFQRVPSPSGTPRFLPDPIPSVAPAAPRLGIPENDMGVALAGIVTPEETLTAHSSPASNSNHFGTTPAMWHLPFLGGIPLPR